MVVAYFFMIKSVLNPTRIENNFLTDSIWCKIKIKHKHCIIGSLYREPNAPAEYFDAMHWTRLLSMQERSLNHIMYNILFELDRHDIYSAEWIIAIKNIQNECSLSYIWHTQTFISDLWLKSSIESILKDQFYKKIGF